MHVGQWLDDAATLCQAKGRLGHGSGVRDWAPCRMCRAVIRRTQRAILVRAVDRMTGNLARDAEAAMGCDSD